MELENRIIQLESHLIKILRCVISVFSVFVPPNIAYMTLGYVELPTPRSCFSSESLFLTSADCYT